MSKLFGKLKNRHLEKFVPSSASTMKVSIVLLVKNGAKFLPKLIPALNGQRGDFEKELVVVDSGSTDGSLEYIKGIKEVRNLGIKVFRIKPKYFGHGKTRNLAVSKCSGEIVVFLSQDALPINENWLKNLLRNFRESRVVGLFGRQVPYDDTNLVEKYFYEFSYPNERRILGQKDLRNFSNQNLFFSNVNAAARKELLLKYPFREDLIMSEDQYWGREVLKKGYKIVYEPKASVYHSHNYNLLMLAKRYWQIGSSQKQIGLEGNVWQSGGKTSLGLLDYVAKHNVWLLPYAMLYILVKGMAFWIGRN